MNLTHYFLLADGRRVAPKYMVRIRYSAFSKAYTAFDNFFYEEDFSTLAAAKAAAIKKYREKTA